jgi:sugar O-acyltransferase (sialic acid O-acetyltransferase NeuD family)
MHSTDLVIVGAAGHASDVVGLVEDLVADGARWHLIGLVADQPPPVPERFAGRAEYLGGLDRLAGLRAHVVVAAGYPRPRSALVARIAPHVRHYATLVHPDARLGTGSTVGAGTVILGGTRLSPKVTVGDHCYVSHMVGIGHDAMLSSFVSIMPAATVSGDTRLGEGTLVGSNASVLEGLQLGDWAVVGAGAVVTRDVAPGSTVTGIPARERAG